MARRGQRAYRRLRPPHRDNCNLCCLGGGGDNGSAPRRHEGRQRAAPFTGIARATSCGPRKRALPPNPIVPAEVAELAVGVDLQMPILHRLWPGLQASSPSALQTRTGFHARQTIAVPAGPGRRVDLHDTGVARPVDRAGSNGTRLAHVLALNAKVCTPKGEGRGQRPGMVGRSLGRATNDRIGPCWCDPRNGSRFSEELLGSPLQTAASLARHQIGPQAAFPDPIHSAAGERNLHHKRGSPRSTAELDWLRNG
jgi:hypothetical protein